MYEHGMKVMACFENKDDYNDLAVTHIWNTPKNKLLMENDGFTKTLKNNFFIKNCVKKIKICNYKSKGNRI